MDGLIANGSINHSLSDEEAGQGQEVILWPRRLFKEAQAMDWKNAIESPIKDQASQLLLSFHYLLLPAREGKERNSQETTARSLLESYWLNKIIWKNSIPSVKKRKKFLGIEGEVVSCVSEIVLLFLNVSETQSRDDLKTSDGTSDPCPRRRSINQSLDRDWISD